MTENPVQMEVEVLMATYSNGGFLKWGVSPNHPFSFSGIVRYRDHGTPEMRDME